MTTKFAPCVFATLVTAIAFAQDQPPQTPLGHLSRAAGAYVGANEYLRIFATTECAYALKRKATPTPEFIDKEVLPGFPPESRQEVKDTFAKMLPKLHSQGRAQIASTIASAMKEQAGDRKTACGLVAGTLVGTQLRTADNWKAVRNQWGVQ